MDALFKTCQLARLSLTTDARRPGPHAVRFGLAVVLYVAVSYASASAWSSAAGLPLFHSQIWITALYMSINAVFGFSQAITEEKEDGTLGLMRLTDISTLSIVLGKSLGRLSDASLLLALQFPFTVVAITLGGVSWAQVHAAYAALAAYLWLVLSIAVLASVIQPTGLRAARWTGIIRGLYVVPPYLAVTTPFRWNRLVTFYHWISLPMRLSDVTESSFTTVAWCPPVAFGLIVGLACLLAAWLAFDLANVERATIKPAVSRASRQRQSQRVWSRPLVWREYVFLTGGRAWLIVRTLVHLAILLSMSLFHGESFRCFAWSAIWGGIFAICDGTWSAARLFRDEIRDQTWSSLVVTPNSVSRLVIDKTNGWLLGMLPSIIIPYVYVIIAEATFPYRSHRELLIGALTTEIAVLVYLHLLVLMTLYVGRQAIPLTLTICFAAGWLYVVAAMKPIARLQIDLFIGTIAILLFVMLLLQIQILRRLNTLSETA